MRGSVLTVRRKLMETPCLSISIYFQDSHSSKGLSTPLENACVIRGDWTIVLFCFLKRDFKRYYDKYCVAKRKKILHFCPITMFHMSVFLSTLRKHTIKWKMSSKLSMNSKVTLNFMVKFAF